MEDLKDKVIKVLGELIKDSTFNAQSMDILTRLLGTIINAPKKN